MGKKVEVAVSTDVGRVREENQDHFWLREPADTDEERRLGTLVVVADGMGGHSGGTVASHSALEAVEATFPSSSEQSMHMPFGGMALMPLMAFFSMVASPLATCGAQEAASPTFGAPAAPVP